MTKDVFHGSPLLVEDLDVTLKLVTYREPLLTTLKYVRRIVKNLKARGIYFKLTEGLYKSSVFTQEHQAHLYVGDRTICFGVE